MSFRVQVYLFAAVLFGVVLFGLVTGFVALYGGGGDTRSSTLAIVTGLIGLHLLSLVAKLSERVAVLEKQLADGDPP